MTPSGESAPYVGPRPYRQDDAVVFFGRGTETAALLAQWSSSRLLVLHGPSGVGKTSLVAAGAFAGLGQGTADVMPIGRVSQARAVPTAGLAEHNPFTFALLSSWSPNDSPTHLSRLSVADYLLGRRELTGRDGGPLPMFAVIDQFEEAFHDASHRDRHLDQFVIQLADALRVVSQLHLLLSIREDSLASLAGYLARLSPQTPRRLRLAPLRPHAALEAVTGPLLGSGRSFAPGAAERLVETLRTAEITDRRGQATKTISEDVEPVVLQVVCSALWDALPDDISMITFEHLDEYGDVDQASVAFCTHAVADVAAETEESERRLGEWLENTFITELGTRNATYEGFATTAGMPNAVARAFESRHLLRAEWRAGSRWYELAHDRLIGPIRTMTGLTSTVAAPTAVTDAADCLRTAENLWVKGELTLAEKHAQEVLRLAEDDTRLEAEAERFLGNLAFRNDQFQEAEGHYRRAAELFERVQDVAAVGLLLAALGRLLLRTGRYADAVEDYQGAVARLPSDLTLRIELARALWKSGQLRGAAAVYGAVLTVAPNFPDALGERGQLRVDLGEHADAVDDLGNLTRLRPDAAARPEVRSARARALAGLGRLDEARAEADAAVAAAPDHGPVLARAAAVAAPAGDTGKAGALLRRAVEATDPALHPRQLAEARRLLASLDDIGTPDTS